MTRQRILVVEDEAVVANDLQVRLRKLGYDVPAPVQTGAAAIEAAREHVPDLILMDVRLKGEMDGIEASGHIRDQFRTPVIFLTAYADDGTLGRAKMTEPYGFILKPFNERELHTAIQVALHKHQGEVALRKSERWFARTLRGLGDAIIAVDTDLKILFLNDVAARLTEWSEKDAAGRGLSEIYRLVDPKTGEPLDDLASTKFQPAGATGNERTLAREATLISRTGVRVAVEDNSSPILDDAGRVAGAVLVFRDISQRKQAEEDHRTNEDQIRTLADSISQLAWMAEADGHIYWYNERWYEYTGRTPDEMRGWGWRAVHDPAILPDVEQQWIESLRTGTPFDMEFPLRGSDGNFRWFLTRVIPFRGVDGKITRWFGTNTDIHEAREVREQLQRANAHLAQFAYSASHDLREPLRNVAVYSQLLGKRYAQVLDAQGTEFLGYITEGATRMETLVADLLTYAESGTTSSAALEMVDATAVLQDVLAGLKTSIDESGAQITYGDLPSFATRAVHLQQLFQNLLANAIKYRAGTPKIRVSADALESEWIFSVKDNGIGIEPEYWNTVFGLFKRLNNPKEYSGTGLGLALCQNIVRLYGGRIWVDSKLGEGATFYFALPR